MKLLSATLCLTLPIAAQGSGAALLSDDFSTGIDGSRWNTVTQGMPCCGAAVFPQSGTCVLQNRGHLVSLQEFDPVTLGPVRITLTFQFTDAADVMTVATRSNALPSGCCGWSETGLFAVVWPGEVTSRFIDLSAGGGVSLSPATVVSGSIFPVQVGVPYSLELIDAGQRAWLVISGGGQSVTLVADVLADNATARFVEFFNRENFLGSHQMVIDDVVIEATTAAGYQAFGSGCAGPNGLVPTLSPVAGQVPRIGSTSNLRVSNLPLAICIPIYAYGLSNSSCVGAFGPYPLPFDLSVLGWPGCHQLVSLEITELEITDTGSADHPLVLPYEPSWVGLNFYAQSVVMYAPTGTAVTNGVHGVIGY